MEGITGGGLNADDGSDDVFELFANDAQVTATNLFGQGGSDLFAHLSGGGSRAPAPRTAAVVPSA